MKPVILVDGSSYFFRAFHALPPLMNSQGQPTGAIYGVVNMIRRLIKDHTPLHLVVVFDTAGPTFRETLYPAYKAHRAAMPEELVVQFEPMVNLLRFMGIPVVLAEGVEADDVIGTLAKEAVTAGETVLISTGDKDFAQLVTDKITLLNTMTNQVFDPQGVKNKFNVRPDQIIDYLALVGDAADHIKGVPQCGPKTAAKWLSTYDTLEQLIANAANISGKIGESLRASLPHLSLAKQLVTIKTDVPLTAHVMDYCMQPVAYTPLLALLQTLEFKNWMKEYSAHLSHDGIAKDDEVTPMKLESQYRVIQSPEAWQAYLKCLQQATCFCLDTETTSLDPLEAQLVGIAFALDPHEAVYVPLQHQTQEKQLPIQQVLADLKPLLTHAKHLKIGQNLKYDYAILKQHGIHLAGLAFDTMLASYVLNSSITKHDLNTLALTYLNYQPLTYEALTKQAGQSLRFDDVPIEKATFYAAEDADVTFQLYQTLNPLFTPGQRRVFQDVELPLVPVLADMELKGVLIDPGVLNAQNQVLRKRLQMLEQEAYTLAGYTFNLNSPNQLQTLLFEKLGLPVAEKTPTGQPSTAEAVLQDLALTHRLPAVIVEYRRLAKLVSTYLEALPKRIHPKTGRVHTSFNQAVTITGRLSSSDPNLQNIPVRSEEGRAIRRAFIAPPGHQLLSADYSQIELRIMAHLSQDERLLRAFENNLDIHAATAAEIFGMPLDGVTPLQRRRAKAVNFGLIYGMSAFGLAKQLAITRHEAEHYVKTYFERYPGVHAYIERIRHMAYEQGYVETIMGRRLLLPDLRSRNVPKRKAAERMAINAPMQGTAAELIKLAMIQLSTWLQTHHSHQATLILQVHDELLFEVAQPALNDFKAVVKTKMEQAMQLTVPLVVSVGIGQNWDEAHQ